MRELLEGRGTLVVAIGVAVLVVAGYPTFGRDRVNDATTAQGERLAQDITAPASQARDQQAQSLLQTAAIAMETLYVERLSFEGAIAAAPAAEPNVRWIAGATAQASQNQVALQLTPTNLGYVLNTTSASGATFTYSRDDHVQVRRTCGPGCTW